MVLLYCLYSRKDKEIKEYVHLKNDFWFLDAMQDIVKDQGLNTLFMKHSDTIKVEIVRDK